MNSYFFREIGTWLNMWPGILLYFIGLAYANSCTGDGFAGKNELYFCLKDEIYRHNLPYDMVHIRLLDGNVGNFTPV